MENAPASSTADTFKPAMNEQAVKALGMRLFNLWSQYERDRRLYELQWLQNLRQFLGIYDPDVMPKDQNRSRAYPKITRVKIVAMVSRLMGMLFPSSEKNWSVNPSPSPNISPDDLKKLLSQVQQSLQGQQVDDDTFDEIVQRAIYDFSAERANNLEREMDDQLSELGGSKTLDYVTLCRKVLYSGALYGCGILKGPMVISQQQTRWKRDMMTGEPAPYTVEVNRPFYEFINLFDYYPDLTAKYWFQQDGQFERHVLSRKQLRDLADREDFMGDAIREYLKNSTSGNYKRRTYESELKALGWVNNVADQTGRKYEAYEYWGTVTGQELAACGVDVPEDKLYEDVQANIWIIENTVIKAQLNPLPDNVAMYHSFIFEETDTSLLGIGLPQIMRDSQMGIAAATRMLMDNASVTCGPQLELNTDLLRMDQDLTSISSYKIWYREGTGTDAGMPAVRNVGIDAHIGDLQSIINMFKDFADTETFVNPAMNADFNQTASEPFRTAQGTSIILSGAALPFRDVVRNFDVFTTSVISSLVEWNREFNDKPELRGDFQVEARGSSSLIAKEVRAQALMAFDQTVRPEDRPYIDAREILMERARALDLDLDRLFVPEEQAKQAIAAQQQAAQAQQQQQVALVDSQSKLNEAKAMEAASNADAKSATVQIKAFDSAMKHNGKAADLALKAKGMQNTHDIGMMNATTNAIGTGADIARTGQQQSA